MNTWHLASSSPKAFALLALAAAAVSQPAMAGSADNSGSVAAHVSHSDLNLTTPEGQEELQRRLDKAAIQVCRFDSKGRLNTSKTEIACHRETRQKVSVQMASIIRDNQLGG